MLNQDNNAIFSIYQELSKCPIQDTKGCHMELNGGRHIEESVKAPYNQIILAKKC